MIKDDLIELKNTRMFLQESAEILKKARAEFDKQNSTLLTQRAKAKIEESALIDSIKKEAIADYNINGIKEIGYGVKVIDTKTMNYKKEDAEKWAFNHKLALCLDAKAFEKIAKAQTLDIVTYDVEHKATIPGKIDIGDDEQ